MKKPQNFALTKVKLPNGGGIIVNYNDSTTEKNITDTLDIKISNSANAHPDLIEKIEGLKSYLSQCYKMDAILQLAKNKGLKNSEQDAFKVVKKTMENVYSEILKKINVTGISLSGVVDEDKDKRSVVITGTQLMENKSKTALNSPRIKLANNQFSFEADLQDIVNSIDEEVQLYLFDNKRAQLDMFEDSQEDELSEDFINGDLKKVEEAA